jgi:glycine dehydrogenase subunit 1
MSALGKQGIRHMAQLNVEKADYMAKSLDKKGFTIINKAAFFNEFVVKLPRPVKEVNSKLLEAGIIGGFDLGNDYGLEDQMLIAVTEQRTKEEIDQFIEVLEAAVNG